jgi:hypothetical protein
MQLSKLTIPAPPKIYYRFSYTIDEQSSAAAGSHPHQSTDAAVQDEHRCCAAMKVLLYSEKQVDQLHARMNCAQRVAVAAKLSPTLTMGGNVDDDDDSAGWRQLQVSKRCLTFQRTARNSSGEAAFVGDSRP